jgi:hypothetical protein
MKRKRIIFPLVIVCAGVAAGFFFGWENVWKGAAPAISHRTVSEPGAYSAKIVQTMEFGGARQVSETRTSRLGEMTRDEWTERGELRVLIWRPDLPSYIQIDPQKRVYVEHNGDSLAAHNEVTEQSGNGRTAIDPQIEGSFDMASEASSSKTVSLPDERVDDFTCEVTERLLSFADGRTQVVRSYRARELGGLTVRTETVFGGGEAATRLTVELKDIQTRISRDQFEIPPGFQKVEKLDW